MTGALILLFSQWSFIYMQPNHQMCITVEVRSNDFFAGVGSTTLSLCVVIYLYKVFMENKRKKHHEQVV